jgi:hypothetical protein
MADAADTDANRTLKPKRKTRARATTAQAKQGDTKHTNTEPLFSLGHLGMSPGALTALLALSLDPNVFIKRHVTGDWSEMEAEDQEVNRRALGHECFPHTRSAQTKNCGSSPRRTGHPR